MTTRLVICATFSIACGRDVVPANDAALDDAAPEDVVCNNNGQLDEGESCDDGNTTRWDGCDRCYREPAPIRRIMAMWTFKSLLEGDVTVPCPDGATTMNIHGVAFDDLPDFEDNFPCADGAGTTSLIRPAGYHVTLSTLGSTYASGQNVEVQNGDAQLAATIYTDAGYFRVSYKLRDAINQQHLLCEPANVTSVRVVVTGPTNVVETFPCGFSGGAGLTSPLLAGTYTLMFEALSGTDVIGTLTSIDQTITGTNRTTPVFVDLPINP